MAAGLVAGAGECEAVCMAILPLAVASRAAEPAAAAAAVDSEPGLEFILLQPGCSIEVLDESALLDCYRHLVHQSSLLLPSRCRWGLEKYPPT